MTEASDLEVDIDVLDDDGLSQVRCRTCGKPVIGNPDGRGCPGCWMVHRAAGDRRGRLAGHRGRYSRPVA